jgi:hypothetical protein
MSGDWTISIVDSGGSVGEYTSIAVDSENKVHISYYDDTNFDLKYGTNETGTWITETVDSADNVGSYTSIALDSDNAVYISYYDGSNRYLKYSTNKSGNWVARNAVYTSGGGGYTSIAIDSNNVVHISYREFGFSDYSIKYANNASGRWSEHLIDSDNTSAAAYTSIVIDSGNSVHIGYFSNLSIKYATNRSGSWINNIVDSAQSVGKHNFASIDSNDKIHVSYSDDSTEMVKYATSSSGTWVISTLYPYDMGDTPFISLATDSFNDAHISYNRWEASNRGFLYYATDVSGVWSLTGVDNCSESGVGKTCNTGIGSSIAIDSDNYAHISYGYYYDYLWCDPFTCIHDTEYTLKYATNVSGDWLRNTITTDINVGNTSIAIDSNDKVHVSYYNEANSRLGYTYQDEQGWWGGDLPFGCINPSLAIDSNNKPHIACSTYNQFSGLGNLRHITPDDLVSTEVDASGYVGEHASLAIDSNNKLHIGYYDLNNKDLRYATNTSGTWITSVIDSRGDVGLFNSTAIDSEDNVYISYYDASNHDLKYATNADFMTTCECDFAPADGDVDGSDLAAYIADQAGISLNDFAAEFGRTDCL